MSVGVSVKGKSVGALSDALVGALSDALGGAFGGVFTQPHLPHLQLCPALSVVGASRLQGDLPSKVKSHSSMIQS